MLLKKYLVLVYGGLGVLCLVLAGWRWHSFQESLRKNSQATNFSAFFAPTTSTVPVVTTPFFYSQLDGLPVSDATSTVPQVLAVMIDNHPDARPQAGLAKAKVVYEVPVEGSFTRYMALFDISQEVAKIGPVRSARPYFLDWLREYGDAMYIHSGGSPEALQLLRQSDIFDINEFAWGKYFKRLSDHATPHNLYTSSDSLQTIAEQKADARPYKNWLGWNYQPNTSVSLVAKLATTTGGENITVPYSKDYVVGWRYDTGLGLYQRLLNSTVSSIDANQGPITAQNIIVQRVVVRLLDSEGRKAITTVGTGAARVFMNGKQYVATWEKKDKLSRTRFYDASGTEIALLPGITWIEIVPTTLELSMFDQS